MWKWNTFRDSEMKANDGMNLNCSPREYVIRKFAAVSFASFHHFSIIFFFFSSRYRLSGLLRMVYRGDIADWVTALLSEPLPSLRCPVWSINRSINHPVIFGRRNIGSLFLNSQLLYVCGVMVGGETTKFLVDTVEGGRIKRKKNKKKIL